MREKKRKEKGNGKKGCPRLVFAERTDAVDRAGIVAFHGTMSRQPARQLILSVRLRRYSWLRRFNNSLPSQDSRIRRSCAPTAGHRTRPSVLSLLASPTS